MRIKPSMVKSFEISETVLMNNRGAQCTIIFENDEKRIRIISSGAIKTLSEAIAPEKITNLSGVVDFAPDYIRREQHIFCCCRPEFEEQSAETILTLIFSNRFLLGD